MSAHLITSTPLRAGPIPDYYVSGGRFEPVANTISLGSQQAGVLDMEVLVRNANGDRAILRIPAADAPGLDMAVVGAGGLNEAVGADRFYTGYVIASRDGRTVALWGNRIDTAIALPADYWWYSEPLFPIASDAGSNLLSWRDQGRGSFWTIADFDVLTNGAATPGPSVVDMSNIGGAERADPLGRGVKLCACAINNKAPPPETVTVYALYQAAGYYGIWDAELANVSPNSSIITVQLDIPTRYSVDPANAPQFAYGWTGAPTGGLSLKFLEWRY